MSSVPRTHNPLPLPAPQRSAVPVAAANDGGAALLPRLRQQSPTGPARPPIASTLCGQYRRVDSSRLITAGFVQRHGSTAAASSSARQSNVLLRRANSGIRGGAGDKGNKNNADDDDSDGVSDGRETMALERRRRVRRLFRVAAQCAIFCMRTMMLQVRGLAAAERSQLHHLFLDFCKQQRHAVGAHTNSSGSVGANAATSAPAASVTSATSTLSAATAPPTSAALLMWQLRNPPQRLPSAAAAADEHLRGAAIPVTVIGGSRHGNPGSGPIMSDERLVAFLRDGCGWTCLIEKAERGAGCHGVTCDEVAGYEIRAFPVPFCVICQIVGRLLREEAKRTQLSDPGALVFSQLAVKIPKRMARSPARNNSNNGRYALASNNAKSSNNSTVASVGSFSASFVGRFPLGGNGGAPNDDDDDVVDSNASSSTDISIASDDEHPHQTIQRKIRARIAEKKAFSDEILASFNLPAAYASQAHQHHLPQTGLAAAAEAAVAARSSSAGFFAPSPPPPRSAAGSGLAPSPSPRSPSAAIYVERVPARLFLDVIAAAGFPEPVVAIFRARAEKHPWLTESNVRKILDDPVDTDATAQQFAALVTSASFSSGALRRARSRIREASAAVMSVLWRNMRNPVADAAAAAELVGNKKPANSNSESSRNAAELIKQLQIQRQIKQHDPDSARVSSPPPRRRHVLVDEEYAHLPHYMRPTRMPLLMASSVVGSPSANDDDGSDDAARSKGAAQPETVPSSSPSPSGSPKDGPLDATFLRDRKRDDAAAAPAAAAAPSAPALPPVCTTAAAKRLKQEKDQRQSIEQQLAEREAWNSKIFAIFGDTTPPPRKTVAEFRFVELATPRRHQQQIATEVSGETVGFTGSEKRWWLKGLTPTEKYRPTSSSSSARHHHHQHGSPRPGSAVSALSDEDKPHYLRRSNRNSPSARRRRAAAAAASGSDTDDPTMSGGDGNDPRAAKQRPPFHVSRERIRDFGPAPPLPGKKMGKVVAPPRPHWTNVNPFEPDHEW